MREKIKTYQVLYFIKASYERETHGRVRRIIFRFIIEVAYRNINDSFLACHVCVLVFVLEEDRETPHSPKSNYVDRSASRSVGPPGLTLHDRYPISPSASENENQLRGPGALRNRSNLRARSVAWRGVERRLLMAREPADEIIRKCNQGAFCLVSLRAGQGRN